MKHIVFLFIFAIFITGFVFAQSEGSIEQTTAMTETESPEKNIDSKETQAAEERKALDRFKNGETVTSVKTIETNEELGENEDNTETENEETDSGISEDMFSDEGYYVYDTSDLDENPNLDKGRIDSPHRIFEIGFKIDASLSNNMFNLNDILKENLEIDLKQIADEMPKNGFKVNLLVAPDFFINLNLKNGFHLGFEAGLETSGSAGIGKSIFEFLGYGNDKGESITADGDASADAFAHFDISLGLDFLHGHHLEIQPAIFLPLFHVATDSASAEVSNTSDGKVSIDADGNFSIYSFTDLEKIIEDKNYDEIVSDLNNGWGFDLATSIDKEVIDNLHVQVYSRIPIVPGKLSHKANMNGKFDGKFDGIQKVIDDKINSSDDEESSTSEEESSEESDSSKYFTHSEDSSFTYSDADYSLHRPFRIGAKAEFKPFGEWLTLGGLLGMGVRNPFSSESKAYAEYSLSANIGPYLPVLGEIIGIELSHGYLSEIFYNQLKFIFNVRVLELNVGAAFKGSSFSSSFNLSGAGLFLYLAFGW